MLRVAGTPTAGLPLAMEFATVRAPLEAGLAMSMARTSPAVVPRKVLAARQGVLPPICRPAGASVKDSLEEGPAESRSSTRPAWESGPPPGILSKGRPDR